MPTFTQPKKTKKARRRLVKQERKLTQKLIDVSIALCLPAFVAFLLVHGTPLHLDLNVFASPACSIGSSPSKTVTERECVMELAGIDSSDYQYASFIFSHESGFCFTKFEGQIGFCPESYSEIRDPSTPLKGYGLCQSTPAIKMQSAGDDWRTNPVTQARWCNGYAIQRYGSWAAAHAFWVVHRWW